MLSDVGRTPVNLQPWNDFDLWLRIDAPYRAEVPFAAAISTGLTGFLGARLLLGVGEAPTFPANSKAIGYWFPAQERSLATAIFRSEEHTLNSSHVVTSRMPSSA